jgi:hypothetical protein
VEAQAKQIEELGLAPPKEDAADAEVLPLFSVASLDVEVGLVQQPVAAARSTLKRMMAGPLRELWGIFHLPLLATHGAAQSPAAAATQDLLAADSSSVLRKGLGLWAALVSRAKTGGLPGFYSRLCLAHVHPLAGLFPWDPGREKVLLSSCASDWRPPTVDVGPPYLFHR